MDEFARDIQDWWPILVTLIGGGAGALIWFIRLENRTLSNDRNLVQLELRQEKQRQADLAQQKEARDNTNQMIRDVQSDIKLLLQRTPK
jgi:hypothetical protein